MRSGIRPPRHKTLVSRIEAEMIDQAGPTSWDEPGDNHSRIQSAINRVIAAPPSRHAELFSTLIGTTPTNQDQEALGIERTKTEGMLSQLPSEQDLINFRAALKHSETYILDHLFGGVACLQLPRETLHSHSLAPRGLSLTWQAQKTN